MYLILISFNSLFKKKHICAHLFWNPFEEFKFFDLKNLMVEMYYSKFTKFGIFFWKKL
jgi:hypothetical protein